MLGWKYKSQGSRLVKLALKGFTVTSLLKQYMNYILKMIIFNKSRCA